MDHAYSVFQNQTVHNLLLGSSNKKQRAQIYQIKTIYIPKTYTKKK